jgi:anti-sigma factor RsiW
MAAPPTPHPTEQTLRAYSLGQLDDLLAEAVHQHLEDCPDCRGRAADMSSDSFLRRLRTAVHGERPETFVPQVSVSRSRRVPDVIAWSDTHDRWARRADIMSRILELPDAVYEALLQAARARGIAPAEWITAQLPRSGSGAKESTSRAPAQDRKAALERLFEQTVSLGHPTGADNELIDADLARAYADPPQVPSDRGRI